MKDNNSKQVLLSVLGVAILVVAVVGVSFAAFSYSQAGEKVKDITLIKTACEQNWEGVAREQFVANVQKAADHVALQYQELFNILNVEINNVKAAMQNFDAGMIK